MAIFSKLKTINFKSYLEDPTVRATVIIAVSGLLSRFLGLARDALFAGKLGAGLTLDIYYAAFRLPDLLFNLLILGTVSVALIPVYTQKQQESKEEASKLAGVVFWASVLTISVLSALLALFLPTFIHYYLPGFSEESLKSAVTLTRILLISPVIFTASSVCSAILHANKRFFWVAFSPLLYNISIILSLFLLYPKFGINGLGVGVCIGAALHFLIQTPDLAKVGLNLFPKAPLITKEAKAVLKLFLPKVLSLEIIQFSLLLAAHFASKLETGSITALQFAVNIQSVPLAFFAISLSLAAFPTLTEHFAKRDEEGFFKVFHNTLKRTLYFTIPCAIVLFIASNDIVGLLLYGGNFDKTDLIRTAIVLKILAVSLIFQAISTVYSRAFYSRHDTKTPVLIGFLVLAANFLSAFALTDLLGLKGLAYSFLISSAIQAILLIASWHLIVKPIEKIKFLTTRNVSLTVVALAAGALLTLLLQKLQVNPTHFNLLTNKTIYLVRVAVTTSILTWIYVTLTKKYQRSADPVSEWSPQREHPENKPNTIT